MLIILKFPVLNDLPFIKRITLRKGTQAKVVTLSSFHSQKIQVNLLYMLNLSFKSVKNYKYIVMLSRGGRDIRRHGICKNSQLITPECALYKVSFTNFPQITAKRCHCHHINCFLIGLCLGT